MAFGINKLTIRHFLRHGWISPVYFLFCDFINNLKGEWWKVPAKFGYLDRDSWVEKPMMVVTPRLVFLEKNTNLRIYAKIINSPGSKFIMRKYSVCAPGLTVVSGNHKPVVGLPHFLSGSTHTKDEESDIIIEEAAWLGSNVTLLHGAHIGRGAIIGAGAIVNKDIPPYAVAVGIPAKVVASVFSKSQIMMHEAIIYPENERLSEKQLDDLFANYFIGKKSIAKDFMLSEEEISRLKAWDKRWNMGIMTEGNIDLLKQYQEEICLSR